MIVSSVIASTSLRPDGRMEVTEVHTDQLGGIHQVYYIAGYSSDINAAMTARVPQINAGLVSNEINTLVNRFAGHLDDPTTYTFNFATQQAFYQALAQAVMVVADVKMVLALKPLITWLQATYTAAQIAAYLGVSTALVGQVNARCTAVFAIASTLNADAPIQGA